MITNKRMDELLSQVDPSAGFPGVQIDQLEKLFTPQFRQVEDCIIISDRSSAELEKHFNKAIKMHTDKTGYEASNTETQIDSFFQGLMTGALGVQIAVLTISLWVPQLKCMDPNSDFCFIVSYNGGATTLRFHKVRTEEAGWLTDDLEDYTNEAVGYIIA